MADIDALENEQAQSQEREHFINYLADKLFESGFPISAIFADLEKSELYDFKATLRKRIEDKVAEYAIANENDPVEYLVDAYSCIENRDELIDAIKNENIRLLVLKGVKERLEKQ